MSEEKKNENSTSDGKPKKDTEVLVEKLREIEAAKKSERESAEAKKLTRENTAKILGENPHYKPVLTDDEAKRNMRNRSRRTFLIGGVSAILGYFGYSYLRDQGETPFRRAFEFNESLSQIYYSPARLAPEFARERVGNLRVNGGEGLSVGFDSESWKLQVVGVANQERFTQYVADIAYDTAMDNSGDMRDTSRQHKHIDAKQKIRCRRDAAGND